MRNERVRNDGNIFIEGVNFSELLRRSSLSFLLINVCFVHYYSAIRYCHHCVRSLLGHAYNGTIAPVSHIISIKHSICTTVVGRRWEDISHKRWSVLFVFSRMENLPFNVHTIRVDGMICIFGLRFVWCSPNEFRIASHTWETR